MQLLEIILYSIHGERRSVSFKTGALNVVTGNSATGKSSLLGIVEYCLGRDAVTFPIGPITTAVSWYAALFQLGPDCRAFVARPVPGVTRASRRHAMLRLGPAQEPLEFHELRVELDSRALREQLGRRIGIRENSAAPDSAAEADLSDAALLCFQSQSEIANSNLLFHRQGERGVAAALKATLPYFIGAQPPAQARKHGQMTGAIAETETAHTRYRDAEEAEQATTRALGPLWDEALTVGMVTQEQPADSSTAIAALKRAIAAEHMPAHPDGRPEDRIFNLRQRCAELRDKLRSLASDRQTILSHIDAASEYAHSLQIPSDRLASLHVLGLRPDQRYDAEDNRNAEACVLCGAQLLHPDPTPAALSQSLDHLTRQLASVAAVSPSGRRALEHLDALAADLRGQLLSAENSLQELTASQDLAGHLSQQGRIDYLRGRIHGVLTTLPAIPPEETARLRQLSSNAQARLELLAGELDAGGRQQEFADRLVAISRDITQWAQQLGLEPPQGKPSLDPKRLTIMLHAGGTRIPLSALGSGQNWVGYHVLAHLALHRYFVRNNRPVPRILMLDQPTQVWFPGADGSLLEADKEAMAGLLKLIDSVVQELAPHFQVILVDHVDLPEPWFQDAVVHTWRGQEKLVPHEWYTAAE